jgi:hypothetical protein
MKRRINICMVIEFSTKASREPTSDPLDSDLGRDLRLGNTGLKSCEYIRMMLCCNF